MRSLIIALIALPIAAHAQTNYDRHGLYIVRPPSVSTVITPGGTYTTTPANPQHPWSGSTTVFTPSYTPSYQPPPSTYSDEQAREDFKKLSPHAQKMILDMQRDMIPADEFVNQQMAKWQAEHCRQTGSDCH